MREFIVYNREESRNIHLLLAYDSAVRGYRFVDISNDIDKIVIYPLSFKTVANALDWLDEIAGDCEIIPL